MTPTLAGRIQTRWISLATVGLGWTLVVGPLLPGGGGLASVAVVGGTTLLLVAAVGTLWELLYHGIQQLRWEKDWPTLFALLVGIPEGIVVHRLLSSDVVPVEAPDPAAFAWLFATTWVVVWAVTSGPVRILFPRWRFRGGRFA